MNNSSKKRYKFAGTFVLTGNVVANIIFVNLTHRLVILPYINKFFHVSYFDLLSQFILLTLILSASIVNGAMISTKVFTYFKLKAFYKSLFVSVLNIIYAFNILSHNISLAKAINSYPVWVSLFIVILIVIITTTYIAIRFFDGLETENFVIGLFFTNPIMHLFFFILIVVVIVPLFNIAFK